MIFFIGAGLLKSLMDIKTSPKHPFAVTESKNHMDLKYNMTEDAYNSLARHNHTENQGGISSKNTNKLSHLS